MVICLHLKCKPAKQYEDETLVGLGEVVGRQKCGHVEVASAGLLVLFFLCSR